MKVRDPARGISRTLHRAGFNDFVTESGSDGTVFLYPDDPDVAAAYWRTLQGDYRVSLVGTYVVVHGKVDW